MGRKQIDSESIRYASLILLLMSITLCTLVCAFFSMVLRPEANSLISKLDASTLVGEDGSSGTKVWSGRCCRGIENLELWGPIVKWVLTLSSILPRSVAWLAKRCVMGRMGYFCVILGCFVGIKRLAGQNSMR